MLDNKFKSLGMGFNYKLTAEIIGCFNLIDPSEELDSLTYLDCNDSEGVIKEVFKENIGAILNPEKHTLLHSFCEQYLYYYLMNERCFLLDEICNDIEADSIIEYIQRVTDILNEYGVVFRDYAHDIYEFEKKYEESNYELYNEYKVLVGKIFDEVLDYFDKIEESIIESTFVNGIIKPAVFGS